MNGHTIKTTKSLYAIGVDEKGTLIIKDSVGGGGIYVTKHDYEKEKDYLSTKSINNFGTVKIESNSIQCEVVNNSKDSDQKIEDEEVVDEVIEEIKKPSPYVSNLQEFNNLLQYALTVKSGETVEIILNKNLEIKKDQSLNIEGTTPIIINFNGHTIKSATGDVCLYVNQKSKLTLKDTVGGGGIYITNTSTGNVTKSSVSYVNCITNDGTLILESGTLSIKSITGIGVFNRDTGTFDMKGGTISIVAGKSDSIAMSNGQVGISNSGKCTLTGGKIILSGGNMNRRGISIMKQEL